MSDDDNEPVHLTEEAETGDRFLVYGTDKGLRLDIRYAGDTLWMTQAQIADLFGRDRTTITRHINNVIEEGELDETTSVQKVHKSMRRPISFYNLDMVISVGYRVSSAQATLFRRWATGILVQFAKKGFVVDPPPPRLKQPDNADRIAELREIIPDIRADEANVYRELRQICAMCQDYDGRTDMVRDFYQKTQAKLVYAVTSHTPAEIVASRADHGAANMGLQTWPKDNIRKTDAGVAKNYLAEAEIRELNRLTTILLDVFEDQLDLGRLVVMQDAQDLLDRQLGQLGRTVLRSGDGSAPRMQRPARKGSMKHSMPSGSSNGKGKPTTGLPPLRRKPDCSPGNRGNGDVFGLRPRRAQRLAANLGLTQAPHPGLANGPEYPFSITWRSWASIQCTVGKAISSVGRESQSNSATSRLSSPTP